MMITLAGGYNDDSVALIMMTVMMIVMSMSVETTLLSNATQILIN